MRVASRSGVVPPALAGLVDDVVRADVRDPSTLDPVVRGSAVVVSAVHGRRRAVEPSPVVDALATWLRAEYRYDSLLDLYSRQRRHAAVKYVQAQTIANKRLMEERNPAVRAVNFDELRSTADDPEAARRYMRRASLLDSLQSANAVA